MEACVEKFDNARLLKDEEKRLLTCMLKDNSFSFLLKELSVLKVIDINDGGMGSVMFIYNDSNSRKFGQQIADRVFIDRDNVAISVAINIDQYKELFEIDIWKVDFSPVVSYPKCQ